MKKTTCRTCGHSLQTEPQLSDAELMRLMRSRADMSLYARGKPDGSADYSNWFLTYGLSRGFQITYEQVKRLVRSGALVRNYPNHDAAYALPEERQRVDAILAMRAERLRQRSTVKRQRANRT